MAFKTGLALLVAIGFLFPGMRSRLLMLLVIVTFSCAGLVALVRWRCPAVSKGVVGFFHPCAEDGGGGERVLWSAVKALQTSHPHLKILLFTGPGFGARDLTTRAQRSFNIRIEPTVEVVKLTHVSSLDPAHFRRLTLLGQALASVWVAWEGLQVAVPQIFVDTSGWAFSYPLAWSAGSAVACYVHYPTISSDMLRRVQSRRSLYNNNTSISNSVVLSVVKLVYYHLFALLYGIAGMFAKVVMVNSSWTRNHITAMWWHQSEPVVVYPPVDTETLQKMSLDRTSEPYLISVAQFRPEKDHRLQLAAYAMARDRALQKGNAQNPVLSSRLKIVGSCRHAADQERLSELKALAAELEILDRVEFYENIPFEELHELLSGAVAGLHTMLDEHFGIVVVEYMAAGVIPIAHNSGGPKLDILAPCKESDKDGAPLGYLKTTVEEYADAITDVLQMDSDQRLQMAVRCRARAQSFSQEKFEEGFLQAFKSVI